MKKKILILIIILSCLLFVLLLIQPSDSNTSESISETQNPYSYKRYCSEPQIKNIGEASETSIPNSESSTEYEYTVTKTVLFQ